jgi:hypothetical protein
MNIEQGMMNFEVKSGLRRDDVVSGGSSGKAAAMDSSAGLSALNVPRGTFSGSIGKR